MERCFLENDISLSYTWKNLSTLPTGHDCDESKVWEKSDNSLGLFYLGLLFPMKVNVTTAYKYTLLIFLYSLLQQFEEGLLGSSMIMGSWSKSYLVTQ